MSGPGREAAVALLAIAGCVVPIEEGMVDTLALKRGVSGVTGDVHVRIEEGVDCHNAALDCRAAIQEALDTVPDGASLEIELVGSMQFDGVHIKILRSHVTLYGDYRDTNRNGQPDPQDHWGTVLRGVDGGDGFPVGDSPAAWFNRGIMVFGQGRHLDEDTEGVTIRGLKLEMHHRPLSISGGNTALDRSDFCQPADGAVVGVVIEDNWIDASPRGVQIFGRTRGAEIRDNLFTGGNIAYLFVGGEAGCANRSFDVGRISDLNVHGNQALDPFIGGIAAGVDGVRFAANRFERVGRFGALVEEATGALVEDNDITGSPSAIAGVYSWLADGSVIRGNRVREISSGAGVYIDCDTTQNLVEDNLLVNNFVDVFLEQHLEEWCDGPSRGNQVTVHQGDTVWDLGTDNTVTYVP